MGVRNRYPLGGGSSSAEFEVLPSDVGIKAWSIDPALADVDGQLSAGTVFATKLKMGAAGTIANALISVNVIGVTLTANQCQIGVCNQAGTLLGRNADQSAAWSGTVGIKVAPLTVEGGQSLTVAAGAILWVVVVANGTTMPRFKTGSSDAATAAGGAAGANLRGGTVLAGQTVLPASIVPANLVAARVFWVGLT